MHIHDGVLPPLVCAGGYAVTAGLAGVSLRGFRDEEVPRIGVLSGLFFIATWAHFQLGTASVHLLLYGLVGIVLGGLSVLALLVGLTFQAVLVGHGGLTTIGVNTVVAASGALASHGVFSLLVRWPVLRRRLEIPATVATLCSFLASGGVFFGMLATGGESLAATAELVLIPYVLLACIEAALTASVVALLGRVRPELIACPLRPPPAGVLS